MAAPGRHQSEGAACGRHTAHMRLCRRAVKPHERAHASLAMYPPGCAVSTARAAVRQHPNGTCPHDHHRCANRCAHVSCTCPEQNSALPVVPTDFVLIAHMRRRACCRRPHLIGARRRADELLAGGASRTSSRTTTEPAARSEPAHRASSSACRHGGDGTCGACGAFGACGSCGKAPHTGLCVYIGGWNYSGVVSGTKTAHAAFGGGWRPTGEEVSTHVTSI